MIPTRDPRPQRFAWAPGSYLCHCNLCQQQFAGDKRATLCAPCAYNDAELEPLRAELADKQAAFDQQRANYIALSNAVLGDGTYVCEVNPVEEAVALHQRVADLRRFEAYVQRFGDYRKGFEATKDPS